MLYERFADEDAFRNQVVLPLLNRLGFLARTMREHGRHPHPDPLPRRGRGGPFDPLAPGGGEAQGEGAGRTRDTHS